MEEEKVAKIEKVIEEIEKTTRTIKGRRVLVVSIIAISMSLFQIWVNSIGIMAEIKRNSLHLGFLLMLAFLLFPARKGSPRDRFTLPDIILVLLGVAVGLYHLFFFDVLHERAGVAIARDYVIAFLAVLLVLEAARRVIGPVLPILSIIFLIYARFGQYFPGIFAHRGLSWTRILYRMYLTYEGLFGITLTVSATYIFMFILFGAFLQATGAGRFFVDFAKAIAGRRRGGPAQVSVLSSALIGTISGSAVANVVTDGVFTIPLMKGIGYPPYFAGAVEAATSTGGMIMPPIMGAAAFVMASFLGVPYVKIMIAAIIPALLYFAQLAITLDLEAKKRGLKGLPRHQLPKLKEVLLKRGHLLLPVFVIAFLLLVGYTPIFTAFAGITATILVSMLRKETRVGWQELLGALESGAKSSLQAGIACAACGFIVGAAAMTGIGSAMAYNILRISGGSTFIALMLIMGVSILLSMGLPSTALYIIVSIVAAPALIGQGLLPITAHFFVFWFGVLSNLTPPVALASYAAAGLAGASPTKTAFTGLKLTLAGFILPYMFAYNPILLAQNITIPALILAVTSALIGVFALSMAVEGFYLRAMNTLERVLSFIAGVLLIKPGWITDFIGLVVLGGVLAYQYSKRS